MTRPVLLDIDADFIVGNQDGDPVDKPIVTGREYARHLKRFKKRNTELHLMIDHHEALFHWDQANIYDALCIHIDAHHDLWSVPTVGDPIVEHCLVDFRDSRRGLRTDDQIDCGNYLHQAMIDDIVGNVIYVPAPYLDLDGEMHDIKYELGNDELFSRVKVRSWNNFKKGKNRLPKADIITIAISPEWLPQDLWPEVKILAEELGIEPSVIRSRKRKATRKWRARCSPLSGRVKYDYSFPYHTRMV